jgi:hypothetical protein
LARARRVQRRKERIRDVARPVMAAARCGMGLSWVGRWIQSAAACWAR